MSNFLDKIISVLPETQKIAIKALIAARAKAGELLSNRSKQEEAQTIYNRIKTKLNKVLLNPKYVNPDDKISSTDINENMQDIYLDLNALYTSIDSISRTTSQQLVTLNSDYEKSKAAILKLLNDARIFALRKLHPEFNEVKLIDFNTSTNLSKKSPVASISPTSRTLQLKPLLTNRVQLTNRTERNTKIYTKTYSPGLKGDLTSSFPPENIVDQHPETFWATVILADSPISQLYEKNSGSDGNYQLSVDGPVVEVYFKFSHIEKINTIKILPFAEFPIKIIDVSYRSSANYKVLNSVKDFEQVSTLDWVELNFDPVLASEVRITIAQENYKKSSYLLPRSVIINTDIFQQILKLRTQKALGSSVFDSDFSLSQLRSLTTYDSAIQALQELYATNNLDITLQPAIDYYNDFNLLLKLLYTDISPETIKYLMDAENRQQPSDSDLVNETKYEYLLGLREVEISYQLYYPTSIYESDKYVPQATVSQIEIDVDEVHTEFQTSWQDNYKKTSVEWTVDLGQGRLIPIHPKNLIDSNDQIPAVLDERLFFDLTTNKAYTRLGSYYASPYRVKKNGDLIPPEAYYTQRITGAIPKIEVSLSGTWFDVNSTYSIDYAVDPSSYSLSILDTFTSEPLVSPDLFTSVGPDNQINLSKFPFINYEIINSTGLFTNDDSNTWVFQTPQVDIASGHAFFYPTIVDSVGNVLQTGSITGYIVTGHWGDRSGEAISTLAGNPNLSLSYFSEINGIDFGYFIKIMDDSNYTEILSFGSNNSFILDKPIIVSEEQCQTWDTNSPGNVLSGQITSPVTGYLRTEYVIGVGVKSDDEIYTISNTSYTPLTVLVGGSEAQNITNYQTLQHPAFSIANNKDRDYQYIHAGNTLYFNQKITDKEIRVEYNWITDYLKIIGLLRFNGVVNPELTPRVNEIKIFTNNLVI